MQVINNKFISDEGSTDVYTLQTLKCVNPSCKGDKQTKKTKVN